MKWSTLFNQNTLDAWISGLGSALGALAAGIITGWIALRIMKKQFKYEENKRQKQINEEFIRIYHAIINLLSLANEVMKILEGNLRLISDEPQQKEKDIQRFIAHLERFAADIDKIDENKIPLNLIAEFYEVKRIISNYSTLYISQLDRFDYLSEEEKKETLSRIEPTLKSKRIEEQQKVNSFIDKFKEYAEKILKENNKK